MSKAGLYISIGFAFVGGYFLLTGHQAHVIEYLPYVLLLACPLLHLFHGHGHGRHEPDRHNEKDQPRAS